MGCLPTAATDARVGSPGPAGDERQVHSMSELNPAQRFTEAIPHAKALDMRLEEIGEGGVVMSMPWDERFIGDPTTRVISGGAVSALMDTCCGAAVLAQTGSMGTATLDLRIEYMRAAKPGQRITARAECFHATRTVAFMRAVAHDEDSLAAGGLPVATATGAFTIESGRQKAGDGGLTK